ncbi:hypothetical protein J5X98_18665 [Leptothermofonsia sichuanensis E412]|uniref:hypothetical protein n=1 Tax=Leptothermofonsia sichuanensis TaxID=2917832 RepID=UPI001CA76925|nr:hypothetical protein [Leptothermofonsia sichuanensis]QZZ19388.1 hypothetical protein J5X98_18665 [Leptothermofonsia sichuanensis E412]
MWLKPKLAGYFRQPALVTGNAPHRKERFHLQRLELSRVLVFQEDETLFAIEGFIVAVYLCVDHHCESLLSLDAWVDVLLI